MDDKNCSSFGDVLSPNSTPMGLDNTMTDGKPHARPFTLGLGGEEGLEDLTHVLGGDPRARILHLKLHKHLPVGLDRIGAQDEPPPVGHGVAGVGEQIEDHLLELVLVGKDRRHPLGEIQRHCNVLQSKFMFHKA